MIRELEVMKDTHEVAATIQGWCEDREIEEFDIRSDEDGYCEEAVDASDVTLVQGALEEVLFHGRPEGYNIISAEAGPKPLIDFF